MRKAYVVRIVRTSEGTEYRERVMGPVKAAKVDRLLLEFAEDEYKHHKGKADKYGSQPGRSYVSFGEIEGRIGFIIESPRSLVTYTYEVEYPTRNGVRPS